jgi:NADPH:quinone reductase-like Zn-dependent oxidoreductase
MKAFVLKKFGGVEKLLMSDIAKPEILPDEVLIEVRAISINPVDTRTRSGIAMAAYLQKYMPLILGWDISGVIVQTGSSVTRFKEGDAVFGMVNFLGHGKGYAEYVAAPAHQLAMKPPNISFEEAAAATLAALTAWQLLKHFARIKSGQRILILAASGGVGHYAVQIAKYFGAYVIGVSSEKNKDFVLSLGADEHIAYDKENYEEILTDNVDMVIDAFGKESLAKSLKTVKLNGLIMSLLPMISEEIIKKAKEKAVDIHYQLVNSNGDDMQSIASLLEQGFLKSHVDELFSFENMANAHLKMETGKTIGKNIVSV